MSKITQIATYAELRELALLSEASIDLQIQFWLTVTFVFASRWYYKTIDLFQYQEMLKSLGDEGVTPVATIISRIILMLLGTLATVYFVYFRATSNNDEYH